LTSSGAHNYEKMIDLCTQLAALHAKQLGRGEKLLGGMCCLASTAMDDGDIRFHAQCGLGSLLDVLGDLLCRARPCWD
jgi:hypothetical protein